VPELAHLPAAALGLPPRIKGYPTPILNYKAARHQRVQQLQHQRQGFLKQENVLSQLARLPKSLIPFGSERFASDIAWAEQDDRDLFPAAIGLDSLTSDQVRDLRTWFVANLEITPHKSSPRAKVHPLDPKAGIQLSLLEL
jgi:deoxyribodipyrimidine photo-lyase